MAAFRAWWRAMDRRTPFTQFLPFTPRLARRSRKAASARRSSSVQQSAASPQRSKIAAEMRAPQLPQPPRKPPAQLKRKSSLNPKTRERQPDSESSGSLDRQRINPWRFVHVTVRESIGEDGEEQGFNHHPSKQLRLIQSLLRPSHLLLPDSAPHI